MKISFKVCLKLSLLVFTILLNTSTLSAQRKSEQLNRGVVAVKNSSSNYFVSWRSLATDPENTQFNLYAKKVGASFVKLNTTPLNITNYQTTSTTVGTGTQLYVTTINNGIESAPSTIFTINSAGFNTHRSAYLDLTYNQANDGLDLTKYSTKFVWPTDLDGDGEYDFVVDRLSDIGCTTKIQAHLHN